MNVKLKILTAGVLFFIGGQTVMAQKSKKDTADTKNIEEVVVVGMGIKREQKAVGYSISTIKKDALEGKASADISNLIVGKAPGVNIVTSGGQSGSAGTITIRSLKSFTGSNDPLFVVDGVPIISDSNSSGSFASGANNVTSRFSDIDPNNIEDIKVLSGLAATNMYGSLGRNGVLLITTKGKNAKDKMTVDLVSTTYFTSIANLPNFQNKYGNGGDFINNNGNVGNWGAPFDPNVLVPHHLSLNTGSVAAFPQYANLTVPYVPVENNIRNYFKEGFGTTNSLTVLGGSNSYNYNLGTSYLNEDGFIPENNFTRFNFNAGGGVRVSDRFRFDGDVTFTQSNFKSPPIAASAGSGISVFERLLYLPRNLDLLNIPYQNPGTGASVFYRDDVDSPMWLTYNSGDKQVVNRSIIKFKAEYKLSETLGLSYRAGYDLVDDNQRFFMNKGSKDATYTLGLLRDIFAKQSLLNQQVLLSMSRRQIFGKIYADAFLGGESRVDEYRQTGLESENQLQFSKLEHNYFATQSSNSKITGDLDIKSRQNTFGLFANFTADYDNMVFLTLAGRNDWTSTTERRNRSLFYPSASLSFDMTKIMGISGSKVNFLKLRSSFGTSASFPSPYNTRNFYNLSPRAFITSTTTYPTNAATSIKGNPDLKPELYKELEFGIESQFFNRRIGLNASYYKRTTTDQIFLRDLDSSTGFSSMYINAGKINGTGVEATLSLVPIKSSDFVWDMTFNFNKMVSKVVEMPEGNKKIGYAGFTNLGLYAVEGQKLGEIYGTYALKDDKGNYLINPANGHIITSSDAGLPAGSIGNNQADYTLSLSNSFSYKGFSLSAQLDFVKGGDIYSDTAANLIMRGVTKDTENREGNFVLPGVYASPTGQIYKDSNGNAIANTIALPLQYIYFLNLRNADGEWVYDGTRLRLRDITLSYSLPKKLFTGTKVTGVTLSLTGNNIWFKAFNVPKYIKLDPDASVTRAPGGGLDFQTAPSAKRIGFTMKVTF